MSTATPLHRRTYEARVAGFPNKCAQTLLETIVRKKTNLSVALDVTSQEQVLSLADAVGPYVCVVKTHVDVLTDFDASFAPRLAALAEKHDFLIFEDRKFADIGQTVRNQYAKGVYAIAEWSHITNAHPIPGDGIVDGLATEGMPRGRGLLLLAEMSSVGTLARGEYTQETLEMACRHRDFVFGFIGQHRLDVNTVTSVEGVSDKNTDFLYLTPGVNMSSKGDSLGQQYNTPRSVILDNDCDVIIVGRGITQAENPADAAKKYRDAGWDAYLEKVKTYN